MDVHLSWLRRKLGETAADPALPAHRARGRRAPGPAHGREGHQTARADGAAHRVARGRHDVRRGRWRFSCRRFLVATRAEDRLGDDPRPRSRRRAVVTRVGPPSTTCRSTLSRTVADLSARGPGGGRGRPGRTGAGQTRPAADRPWRWSAPHQPGAGSHVNGGARPDAVVPVSTTVASGWRSPRCRRPSCGPGCGVRGRPSLALGLGAGGRLGGGAPCWPGRRTSVPVTEVAEVAHRLREGDSTARAVPGGPPRRRSSVARSTRSPTGSTSSWRPSASTSPTSGTGCARR